MSVGNRGQGEPGLELREGLGTFGIGLRAAGDEGAAPSSPSLDQWSGHHAQGPPLPIDRPAQGPPQWTAPRPSPQNGTGCPALPSLELQAPSLESPSPARPACWLQLRSYGPWPERPSAGRPLAAPG